jgi:hypothetical protein
MRKYRQLIKRCTIGAVTRLGTRVRECVQTARFVREYGRKTCPSLPIGHQVLAAPRSCALIVTGSHTVSHRDGRGKPIVAP